MQHDVSLIATVVLGLVLAFGFGFVAIKLRLPPLVGYLLAGVALGPFTPGLNADVDMASQLAEIGVILLMFGVGLHFSTADLVAVRWIALPGAVAEICVVSTIGTLIAMSWGWSLGAGLVLGLSLSVASTVVLLRALDERNAVDSVNGRVAVGWLIVEDLVMVLALVLLPAVAEISGRTSRAEARRRQSGADVAITLGKVALFVGLVLALGPRVVPWLLGQVARVGSRELFTLSVLAVALGIAYGSAALFGVSFALGAFFAGVVLSESRIRPQGRRGFPAAAGCVRGAVLRLRRDAVRSLDPHTPAAGRRVRAAADPARQVARGDGDRAAARLSAGDGADGFRQPDADRRILLHPGRDWA